jgi:hypothetical protein
MSARDPLHGVTKSTYELEQQGRRGMHDDMNRVHIMHPGMQHVPPSLPTLNKRMR